MIWSLWLTFESDGQTLLAIGSDSRPFGWFPFSRPTWAKVICRSWWWSEESRSRRTFQSRSSSLGPHLGSGQDINVHLYKCFFLQRCCIVNCFPIPIIAITSLSAKHHSRSLFRKKERNLSLPEKNSLWSSRRWPGVPRWREKLSNWV